MAYDALLQIGFVAAIVAVFVAFFTAKAVNHSLRRDIVELNYDLETIEKTLKRKTARDGMQAKRDEERENEELLAAARAAVAASGQMVDITPPGNDKSRLRSLRRP